MGLWVRSGAQLWDCRSQDETIAAIDFNLAHTLSTFVNAGRGTSYLCSHQGSSNLRAVRFGRDMGP